VVERVLAEQLGAVEVQLQDNPGHHIHGRTQFSNALPRTRFVQIVFQVGAPDLPDQAESVLSPATALDEPSSGGGQGARTESEPPNGPTLKCRDNITFSEEFLIREFDRRERERGHIVAGFIVNDLLPRLGGYEPLEAKHILRRLQVRGVVVTRKVPSPRNPDRDTTLVQLNRDHPDVRRVLGNGKPDDGFFEPVPIRGEPASVTLIRDRR